MPQSELHDNVSGDAKHYSNQPEISSLAINFIVLLDIFLTISISFRYSENRHQYARFEFLIKNTLLFFLLLFFGLLVQYGITYSYVL